MENSENKDTLRLSVGGGETARLRLFFLAPLTLVIMAAVGLFVFEFYRYQQQDVQSGVVRVQVSAPELYRNSIRHNAIALQTILEMLEKDQALHAALERGDRATLLEKSAPLFADLRKIFGVTHFYFTRADRVNLLRVHQPERYGDVIERFTTREAQRTGALAQGVELGPLGALTLRVVDPWYADKERKHLIGYVELGMEVDHALEEVREFLGVQTFVLIRKQFLQRDEWESGMLMLGRVPEWERFPDFALSSQGMQTIPDALSERIGKVALAGSADIVQKRVSYRSIAVPLRDAAGADVGQLMLLVDVSHEAESARKAIVFGSMIALAAGILLFGLFYWLVGRVGAQLESRSRMLADLAMRDGLTKLLNHRTFYALLEKEVARAQRYEKPLALLMLDIDHFKRVNDIHGHVAGDMILAGLSSVISNQVRDVDSVCRYGGEEISVILPETGMETAAQMAERIRSAIEGQRFDIGQGQSIGITVSIGVAALPAQETSVEKLVAVADKALYEAKEGGRNRVCRGK
ncbi:MAG TPA: diguanylate cyclase [Gallionellaceae bacterium]|nr:diguanylate cyclase [Gallionellaceae bacterium]